MLRRILTSFLLVLLAAASLTVTTSAQSEVIKSYVEYDFGEQITFHASITSDRPVEKISIFISSNGNNITETGGVTVIHEDDLYTLEYIYNVQNRNLRPFSQVRYFLETIFKDGTVQVSPTYAFTYEDNRYEWQRLEEKPFRVNWREGDRAFAQNILDIAQQGLEHIQKILPIPAPESIEIYVYPNSTDLQSAFSIDSANWVAGHADPDLKVMLVALPEGPEQEMLAEQRIPHELMHILLYQYTREGYANLPTWLNEGLASISELLPNPDYQILLDNALQKGTILPFASICQTFPRDTSSALVAYAQSDSFVRYLYNVYGSSGLDALVLSYADGIDCEHGVRNVFNLSLDQLEKQWRQEAFTENIFVSGLKNFSPWLALVLIPLTGPLVISLGKLKKRPALPVSVAETR